MSLIAAERFHPFETKHLQTILLKRALEQLRFLRGTVSFDAFDFLFHVPSDKRSKYSQ